MSQIETLELKSTVTDEKLTEEVQRHIWAGRRIWTWRLANGDYSGWRAERENKDEQSPRVPWDTIKHTNICIIGIPEKEKRKGQKKYISKNYAKNFQISWNTVVYKWVKGDLCVLAPRLFIAVGWDSLAQKPTSANLKSLHIQLFCKIVQTSRFMAI